MVVIRRDSTLLVVAENGFGKRSELADYRVQKRGKGIITPTTPRRPAGWWRSRKCCPTTS